VPLGAAGPMIHCICTLKALITNPWSVARRFPTQIRLIHWFIGAAVPRGAAGPALWPCDAPMVLMDIQDHSLMAVAAVKCGPIDPSASNHSLLIKLTIYRSIS
jgi:hypothetical protein